MQFLVTGYDGADSEALNRRLAARETHLAGMTSLKSSGHLLFAAAILSDDGKMIGSSLIMEFDSRAHLDDWLKSEPYTTGEVWKRVEIHPCKVAPLFS